MRLIDLQRDFQAAALRFRPDSAAALARLKGAAQVSPGATLDRRLAIHCHLDHTIADSLAGGFSGTSVYLGHAGWHDLIRRYLLDVPPMHSAVGRIPEYLEDFLRRTPPYCDDVYLCELFHWESHRRRALAAAVELPLTRAHLSMSADERHRLPIAIKRRSYLVEVAYPFHVSKPREGVSVDRVPRFALFGNVKRGRDVARPVSGIELSLLRALSAGAYLGDFEATLAERADAETARAIFTQWLDERVLVVRRSS